MSRGGQPLRGRGFARVSRHSLFHRQRGGPFRQEGSRRRAEARFMPRPRRAAAGGDQIARKLLIHHIRQSDAAGGRHFLGQLLIVHILPELFLASVQQTALGQGIAHFLPHLLDKYRFKAFAGLAQLFGLGLRRKPFAAEVAQTSKPGLKIATGIFAGRAFRWNHGRKGIEGRCHFRLPPVPHAANLTPAGCAKWKSGRGVWPRWRSGRPPVLAE